MHVKASREVWTPTHQLFQPQVFKGQESVSINHECWGFFLLLFLKIIFNMINSFVVVSIFCTHSVHAFKFFCLIKKNSDLLFVGKPKFLNQKPQLLPWMYKLLIPNIAQSAAKAGKLAIPQPLCCADLSF